MILLGVSETTIAEELLGKWFKDTGRRSEIFLATKFGAFEPGKPQTPPNSRPDSIKQQLDRSLSLLQTTYVDLYYQHRVDPNVPIEIVMQGLREPVKNETVRWIGLSECSADHIRRAKSDPEIGHHVVACQVEFSPFELYIEKGGLAQACEEQGVAIVPYSPLGRGMVTGK